MAAIERRDYGPIARTSAAAIVNALPALLERADTLNGVLLSLVKALQPYVPGLWRLSLRRYLPREEQLELVAVWSASDTQVPAGLRVSARASSLPEVMKAGGPIFSVDAAAHQGLLEQVMAAEGVASWVAIPLHEAERLVALLNISSMDPKEIEPSGRAFFERIGRAVERRVVVLTAVSPLRGSTE